MDDDILFTIVKILFVFLFIWIAISLSVASYKKGKRFSNTEWPYSVVNRLGMLPVGKHMEKKGWKLSKREIIGGIIILVLMLAAPIIR
jgi:hypothetical protein